MKVVPHLHYCYLLLSETKKKASYIGYSVNPCRRLRQHNGEIKKGAKKTKGGVPWSLGICVGGFPDRVAALRFEWAWQHPNICRVTRDAIESWRIVKTKRTAGDRRVLNKRQWSIQQRVSILLCMTTLEPWRSMNLTVFVFRDELESTIKEVLETTRKLKVPADFTSPNVLNKDAVLMFLYLGEDVFHEKGVKFLKCDYDTFREIQKSSFDCDSDSNIEDNSGVFNPEIASPEDSRFAKCSLCQKVFEDRRSYVEFPCCTEMTVHLSCIQSWGESGCHIDDDYLDGAFPLKDLVAPLVPLTISCPCCFKAFSWVDVKKCHLRMAVSLSARGSDSEKDVPAQNAETEKENSNIEENSQSQVLEREDLGAGKCEDGPHFMVWEAPREDEFSEISQKCEFIDLTVDSD